MKKKSRKKKMTMDGLAGFIEKSAKDTKVYVKKEIESLASMTQKGFVDLEGRLGKRIDGVEQGLGGVDQRLNGVEVRLDGVEQRLDGVEVRLGGVEKRLDGVAFDVSDLKKGQEEILRKLDDKVDRKEFAKLERRVRFLEKMLVSQKKN